MRLQIQERTKLKILIKKSNTITNQIEEILESKEECAYLLAGKLTKIGVETLSNKPKKVLETTASTFIDVIRIAKLNDFNLIDTIDKMDIVEYRYGEEWFKDLVTLSGKILEDTNKIADHLQNALEIIIAISKKANLTIDELLTMQAVRAALNIDPDEIKKMEDLKKMREKFIN